MRHQERVNAGKKGVGGSLVQYRRCCSVRDACTDKKKGGYLYDRAFREDITNFILFRKAVFPQICSLSTYTVIHKFDVVRVEYCVKCLYFVKSTIVS